jgi:hypothetical protein
MANEYKLKFFVMQILTKLYLVTKSGIISQNTFFEKHYMYESVKTDVH